MKYLYIISVNSVNSSIILMLPKVEINLSLVIVPVLTMNLTELDMVFSPSFNESPTKVILL